MIRRLPQDAFAYFVSLGVGRSYLAVARRYGVSKTAVANLADRENWQTRIADIDRKVAESATQKAVESIEAMNERHVKLMKAIQGKALETLRTMPIATAIDAVRALDLSVRQERMIRGEPSEHAVVVIE